MICIGTHACIVVFIKYLPCSEQSLLNVVKTQISQVFNWVSYKSQLSSSLSFNSIFIIKCSKTNFQPTCISGRQLSDRNLHHGLDPVIYTRTRLMPTFIPQGVHCTEIDIHCFAPPANRLQDSRMSVRHPGQLPINKNRSKTDAKRSLMLTWWRYKMFS